LTLVSWQDQRPAYSAHTPERFGIATGDDRELGQVWSAQDWVIAVLADVAS
jgi:hypothetical protein